MLNAKLCPYCNEDIFGDPLDYSAFYYCYDCNASFLVSKDLKILSNYLWCKISNKRLSIQIDYENNITRIFSYPKGKEVPVEIALINSLSDNITPSNIKEKLSIYINFL